MEGIDLPVMEAENGMGRSPAAEVEELQVAVLVPNETRSPVCHDVHGRQFRVFSGEGQSEGLCSRVQYAHAAII